MKKIECLPVILSRLEVVRLLHRLENQKHQLLIALTYGAGLRVSEVVNLKVNDINFKASVIHLKNRQTILAKNLKVPLWRFVQKKKKTDNLFKLNERTAQKIFEKALQSAGVSKKAPFHSLRHSFANHLREEGIDLKCIQKLLGHKNLRTTKQFTHTTNVISEKIQSPLERVGFLSAPPKISAKFQGVR